jgi:hypothetical protein
VALEERCHDGFQEVGGDELVKRACSIKAAVGLDKRQAAKDTEYEI